MLVEHTFVTTLEGPQALALAHEFLLLGGFWVHEADMQRLEMRRGREKVAKAKGLLELPQQVRIEFDRGRVNVAVQVQQDKKASAKCQQLLVAIANSIEQLLVRGDSVQEVRRPLHALETEIAEDYARHRRRTLIFVIVLLAIIFSTIGLIIAAAMSRG